MNLRIRNRAIFLAISIVVSGVNLSRADEAKKKDAATPEQAGRAIARGLDFLVKDAIAWRKEKTCSTCHHGTMTVWALAEAKSRGHAVAADTFADMLQWTKERLFKNLDNPRDTRQGWKMVNSPALVLAMMAQNVAKQDALTPEDLKRIAGHLLRHQEEDGKWAWSEAPPVNRPPPFFESDEVATLLAMMALAPHEPADPKEKSELRDARARGAAWLAKNKPTDTTQAAALRLLAKLRAGPSGPALQLEITQFLSLQRKDGGWGQVADRESDAYATGQALYVLNLAGVKADRPEIQRGVAYLIAGQREDGSWPMTRRGHPGVTPSKYVVPITYFGSAWATLGLMRSTPAVTPPQTSP
jgi:hypothetical protein